MRSHLMTEDEPAQKTGFNLVVTHRDEKTGLVVERDPYILRVCEAAGGGKSRSWERPAGSGNLFDKKGHPIGRWVKGKLVEGAEHIAFVRPLTADQQLAKSLGEKDIRIAELERELKAIETERTPAAPKKNGQGA